MVRLRARLKPSIYILKESEDKYTFVFTSSRKVLTFQVDTLVKETIERLGQERDYEELVGELSRKYDIRSVKDCLNTMEYYGILKVSNNSPIEPKFVRQLEFLDEFTSSYDETLKLHERLRKSKVSVFGIGGIGSWIANGLYQIGIGHLVLCDPDKIEISNLNRQLFFSEKDIGKDKVDVAKEHLPDVRVDTYKRFVSSRQPLEDIIEGSDFIVNCADSPSVQVTSEVIDSYATRLNIPYLFSGGYNLHLGMVGPIIVPGKTLTFNDFLRYQKENDRISHLEKIKDIESTGNLGPIAGAIANIQVMEIFKYLTGKGKLNLNRFGEIDFMDLNVKWKQFGPEVKL
jgi:molybdopterin-synthase adenylyltransferase